MSVDPFSVIPAEVDWERSSPSVYLAEAFSALLEMFDAQKMEGPVGRTNHRVRWSRISMVFSAFAAEGYVNRALLEALPARDFAALDKLSTVDKYAVGGRLAFGKTMFDRGAEPLQSIAALFDVRNEMAHPKPKSTTISREELFAGPEVEIYSATAAVRFAVGVAEAANLLVRESQSSSEEVIASTIVTMKDGFARSARQLDSLPRPTAEDYRKVWERVQR